MKIQIFILSFLSIYSLEASSKDEISFLPVFPKSKHEISYVLSLESKRRILSKSELESISNNVLTRFIYLKNAVRASLSEKISAYLVFDAEILVNPVNKALNNLLSLINQSNLLNKQSIHNYMSQNRFWAIIAFRLSVYNNIGEDVFLLRTLFLESIEERYNATYYHISKNSKVLKILEEEEKQFQLEQKEKIEFFLNYSKNASLINYPLFQLLELSKKTDLVSDTIFKRLKSLSEDIKNGEPIPGSYTIMVFYFLIKKDRRILAFESNWIPDYFSVIRNLHRTAKENDDFIGDFYSKNQLVYNMDFLLLKESGSFIYMNH